MGEVAQLFPAEQTVVAARFEELWRLWPNKTKKPLARAKYEAILRGDFKTKTFDKDSNSYVDIDLGTASEEEILAGVEKYLAGQRATGSGNYGYKDGGRYIPHLATFLNQGRWQDFT